MNIDSDVLNFDALDEAEKVTGRSYKDDDMTMRLGMAMMSENISSKESMLNAADDTLLSNDLDNYVRIITEEGFELALTTPFVSSDGRNECMYTYWHLDGILLNFDTYCSTSVNGGNFYYNWIPNNGVSYHTVTSSGGFREHDGVMVWSGNHDCREALRHSIRQLRENGKLLPEWVEQPFLWLLHHGDTETEGYDYDQITEERLALLPRHVQEAIAGKDNPS